MATSSITKGMSDFLQMGGYAAYVWPAYGVSALALGGLALAGWRRGRRLRRRLRAREESANRKAEGSAP